MKIDKGNYLHASDGFFDLFTLDCHESVYPRLYPLDVDRHDLIADWWVCEAEEIVSAYQVWHDGPIQRLTVRDPEAGYAFAAAWEQE